MTTSTYIPDYEADAARYRREASRNYRRATTAAHRAARWYAEAASSRRLGRWATRYPDLPVPVTPGRFDADTRTAVQIADGFLSQYWRDLDFARRYGQLAAEYAARAAGGS